MQQGFGTSMSHLCPLSQLIGTRKGSKISLFNAARLPNIDESPLPPPPIYQKGSKERARCQRCKLERVLPPACQIFARRPTTQVEGTHKEGFGCWLQATFDLGARKGPCCT
eukprot:1148516-Pelagomonas_calceolata.AAC.4